MGLFTKNTMNLDQMTEFCAFMSFSIIEFHIKNGGWMSQDQKRIACDDWLRKTGYKASWYRLARLITTADKVARLSLLDYSEKMNEVFIENSEAEKGKLFRFLWLSNKDALLLKNITR